MHYRDYNVECHKSVVRIDEEPTDLDLIIAEMQNKFGF